MVLKLMGRILHDINQQIIFHIDLVLPSEISGNINNTIEILKTFVLKAKEVPGNHFMVGIMEPLYFPAFVLFDKAYNPTLSPLELSIQAKPFTPADQYIIIKPILLNQSLGTHIVSHVVLNR
jgi:hypothetical protein